jgi:hypothetical protein
MSTRCSPKTEHDSARHRSGDVAVASLLGAVLLISIPLLPTLSDGLTWMAQQASDVASYRTFVLGIAP